MRFGGLWVLLLSIWLLFTTAGVAWAHVVVSPKEAPANSFQKFVVSVPTEKDIPPTGVTVEVPEGFTGTGVQPVPGWQHEFEKDGGIVTAISWSGGEIQPEEFQEFAVQAKTPKETGEFSWRALQTYEDSSVVEWTGPPDSDEPASVVKVVADSSKSHGSEGTANSARATLPESGGVAVQGVAAYGGLGLGALILITVVLLVLRWRRSP